MNYYFFPFCLFQVQGKDPSVDFTQDVVEESEDERCFDDMMSGDSVPPIELPPAEVGRLEEISELVSSCLPSPMRRWVEGFFWQSCSCLGKEDCEGVICFQDYL